MDQAMKLGIGSDVRRWIGAQDWYQTIDLSNGLTTPGKFDTRKRLHFFENVDVRGKRVLDVGCNSGQLCLWASQRGAREVVGVDIDEKRLAQARHLADIEGHEIRYETASLFDIGNLGEFDLVFCIAVLTEIRDLFGAVEALRNHIGDLAFVEIDLAKPMFYWSKARNWRTNPGGIHKSKAVAEVRKHKRGWMISPSLETLKHVFGEEFKLEDLGTSLRYDMVRIQKSM